MNKKMRNFVKVKKIGIVTSGGDAPGMNAAIRSITKYALNKKYSVSFVKNGYTGLLTDDIIDNITKNDVGAIGSTGGTILGTSRYKQFSSDSNLSLASDNLRKHKIDVLIVIGGEGSFIGANNLSKHGIPFIGVPGTIDNDIPNCDETLGFDTCLNTITESIEKLRVTASSHHRCIVVETMGRNVGYLASYAGIATGSDIIIIPEIQFSKDDIIREVIRRRNQKKIHTIIIMCENLLNIFSFAKEVENATGITTRAQKLGPLQRGGTPTFRDKFLGTLLGIKAMQLVEQNNFNVYIGVQGNNFSEHKVNEKSKTKDTIKELTGLLSRNNNLK